MCVRGEAGDSAWVAERHLGLDGRGRRDTFGRRHEPDHVEHDCAGSNRGRSVSGTGYGGVREAVADLDQRSAESGGSPSTHIFVARPVSELVPPCSEQVL